MFVKLTGINKLMNAITKARKEKPLVRVIEFRHYEVTNKKTLAAYMVYLGYDEAGNRVSSCTCKAGTPATDRFGVPLYDARVCYHVAAAAERHLQLASELYEAAEAARFDNVRYLPSYTGARAAQLAA